MSHSIEALINLFRKRANVCIKFLFYLDEVIFVIVGNEVDCQSKMSESATASDTMKVGFTVFGEVEVDDDVDRLDIDTSRK
jgi:hypothetical protein